MAFCSAAVWCISPTARRTGFWRFGDNYSCRKPRTHQQDPGEAHELSLHCAKRRQRGTRCNLRVPKMFISLGARQENCFSCRQMTYLEVGYAARINVCALTANSSTRDDQLHFLDTSWKFGR